MNCKYSLELEGWVYGLVMGVFLRGDNIIKFSVCSSYSRVFFVSLNFVFRDLEWILFRVCMILFRIRSFW